jgi:GrpB-like predicted nucleotidyltransferase (UPF0157 family)
MRNFQEEGSVLFEKYKELLTELLGQGSFVSIDHVGGTSIPDCYTKGDLDMDIKTTQKQFPRVIEKLKTIYQIKHPELWTDCFAIFYHEDQLSIDTVVMVENSKYDTFTTFRDILRENRKILDQYNQLKKDIEHLPKAKLSKLKIEFISKVLHENKKPLC